VLSTHFYNTKPPNVGCCGKLTLIIKKIETKKLILIIIMKIVRKIRHDKFHYLSVPDDIISCVKSDRIMKIRHIVPSVIVTILLAIKVFPLISVKYAEQLEENGNIILFTVVLVVIPMLVINGIILESILEKTNTEYKNYKKNN